MSFKRSFKKNIENRAKTIDERFNLSLNYIKEMKYPGKNIKPLRALLPTLAALLLTTQGLHAALEEREEVHNKMAGKALQYYHNKEYGPSLVLLERILANEPGRQEVHQYYLKAAEKQTTALIYGRQARILLDNDKHLQAKRMIEEALEIDPYSEVLLELQEIINEKLSKIKPLSHLNSEEKENYDTIISAAQKELNAGANEAALNTFAKALLLAPDSPEAIDGYNISQLRYQEDNYSARTEDMFAKAQQLVGIKQYTAARNVYDEILRYDPANIVAAQQREELSKLINELSEDAEKRQLAAEYLKTGRGHESKLEFETAIESYQLGMGILPEYTDWKGLIKAAESSMKAHEENRFKAKLGEIEKGFQQGMYYLASDDFARAIAEFENVIQISNEYNQVETGKQAEELLKKAQENMRKREEEIVTESSPYYKMVNTLKIMGLNAYNEGHYDLAKDYFFSILELFPKNRFARIYYLKSSIELQPGSKGEIIAQFISDIEAARKSDPAEALRLLRISIEIDPQNPKLTALSKELEGKAAIDAKPKLPKATLDAWYKEALGKSQSDPEAAIATLRKLIKADPTYVKARTLMAQLEGRISQTSWQPQAAAIDPQAQKFYSEGIWHYNNGRIQEAKTSFEKALRIEPNFPKAKTALEKCKAYLM